MVKELKLVLTDKEINNVFVSLSAGVFGGLTVLLFGWVVEAIVRVSDFPLNKPTSLEEAFISLFLLGIAALTLLVSFIVMYLALIWALNSDKRRKKTRN